MKSKFQLVTVRVNEGNVLLIVGKVLMKNVTDFEQLVNKYQKEIQNSTDKLPANLLIEKLSGFEIKEIISDESRSKYFALKTIEFKNSVRKFLLSLFEHYYFSLILASYRLNKQKYYVTLRVDANTQQNLSKRIKELTKFLKENPHVLGEIKEKKMEYYSQKPGVQLFGLNGISIEGQILSKTISQIDVLLSKKTMKEPITCFPIIKQHPSYNQNSQQIRDEENQKMFDEDNQKIIHKEDYLITNSMDKPYIKIIKEYISSLDWEIKEEEVFNDKIIEYMIKKNDVQTQLFFIKNKANISSVIDIISKKNHTIKPICIFQGPIPEVIFSYTTDVVRIGNLTDK